MPAFARRYALDTLAMMQYQISEDDLPALALGILKAIRAGTVSPQVGIWTLGRPIIWEPLQQAKLVPQEIIDVLQQGDELSAIGTTEARPHAFNATVGDLIERLHTDLKEMPCQTWQVEWSRTVGNDTV